MSEGVVAEKVSLDRQIHVVRFHIDQTKWRIGGAIDESYKAMLIRDNEALHAVLDTLLSLKNDGK